MSKIVAWSDADLEFLRAEWMKGSSASIISRLIGRTRSAVLGKINRLGLMRQGPQASTTVRSLRRALPPKLPPGMAQRQRTELSAARITARVDARKAAHDKETTTPLNPAPEGLGAPEFKFVTLMELADKMCKWPVNDPANPGFRYCGCETEDKYCPYHRKMSYAPPVKRTA